MTSIYKQKRQTKDLSWSFLIFTVTLQYWDAEHINAELLFHGQAVNRAAPQIEQACDIITIDQ